MDEEILAEIINHLNTAVYVTGADERILLMNRAAQEMDNVSEKEALGSPLKAVYGELTYNSYDSPTVRALHEKIYCNDENLEWFSNGKVVQALTSTFPIMENGEIIAVCTLCDSIPKMKQRIVRNSVFQKKRTYDIKTSSLKNGTRYVFEDILGNSSVMWNAIETAKKFASKKGPVMLYGETGTGKEMFAQSIHNASQFYKGPFVAVNCAAIPETLLESTLFGTKKGAFTGSLDSPGLFEKADGGTLFLDEINSLPMQLQAKLLRVLQEKEVQRVGDHIVRRINCRIISATNDMPNSLIIRGKLREDLYYRLSGGLVIIPPLRSRGEDLEILIEHTIENLNTEYDMFIIDLTPELRALFRGYSWPGNVREFMNVMESAYNLADGNEGYLSVEHLPSYVREKMKGNETGPAAGGADGFKRRQCEETTLFIDKDINHMVDLYERQIIETALKEAEGKLSGAARLLGISRQALSVKLKKFEISPEAYKNTGQS